MVSCVGSVGRADCMLSAIEVLAPTRYLQVCPIEELNHYRTNALGPLKWLPWRGAETHAKLTQFGHPAALRLALFHLLLH